MLQNFDDITYLNPLKFFFQKCLEIPISVYFYSVLSPWGVLWKVLYWEVPPEGATAKATPLVYLLLKKVLLSHIYLRIVHRFLDPWNEVNEHYYGRTLSIITRRDVNQETSIICSVHVVVEVKILRFPNPFIYLNLWNPCLFIYLKPEKGTLFGRSLHVEVIIGSTLPLPSGA